MKITYDVPEDPALKLVFELFMKTLEDKALQNHIIRNYLKGIKFPERIVLSHNKGQNLKRDEDFSKTALAAYILPNKFYYGEIVLILENIEKFAGVNKNDILNRLPEIITEIYVSWIHELRHIPHEFPKNEEEKDKCEEEAHNFIHEFRKDLKFQILLKKGIKKARRRSVKQSIICSFQKIMFKHLQK